MRQARNSKKTKVFKDIVQACVLGASLIGASAAWADCPDDYQKARAGDYDVKGAEVVDKKSGLTLQRCAVGQTYEEGRGCVGAPKIMSYEQAQAAATGGWRLPTRADFDKIKMEGCSFPAINTILFLNLEGRKYWYWSSTEADGGVFAMQPDGGVVAGTKKTDLGGVILVK